MESRYALVGLNTGTVFVDLSVPTAPIYLGILPAQTTNPSVRDVKVLSDTAYVTSEAADHGMQIFDLTRLRLVAAPPVTFTVDAHYSQIGRAHNVVVNATAQEAYVVGSQDDDRDCGAGLHIIDLSVPLSPTFKSCFSADGYTHDAQCVAYHGPDPDYFGQQICFNFNTDTLTIVDVSGKPVQISRSSYTGSSYPHQGWLTEDQRFLVMNDEGDEADFGHNTRTRIWDVSDLDAPFVSGLFDGPNPSVDHNLYVHEKYVYAANYSSGMQILDAGDICNGNLTLAAYFDTHPEDNAVAYSGAWSAYPYFASGIVIVSSIAEGLFVLQHDLGPAGDQDCPTEFNYFPLIAMP